MSRRENLTTDERRDVRQALIDRGFRRGAGTTLDDGFGRYTETFVLAETEIAITWGPKPEQDKDTFMDTLMDTIRKP